MDDEYEVEGLRLGDAIENEHGLYSEVPRSCSVRSRHDDGDAADDKGHQRTGQS